MRLIQFETGHAQRRVGVVEGDVIQVVRNTTHMRELAWRPSATGAAWATKLLREALSTAMSATPRCWRSVAYCHRWTTKIPPIAWSAEQA